MSNFTEIANKFNTIAKTAFSEHDDALREHASAQRQAALYPIKDNVSADYARKAARAQERFSDATEALTRAERALDSVTDRIEELEKEFAETLAEHYAAKPAEVDHATITLLESGIMGASEYERLLKDAVNAGNSTMARLIGSAAARRAEKEAANDTTIAQRFRSVANDAKIATAGEAERAAFKTMKDLYRRCTRNIALRDQWDYFADNTINKL